VITRATADDIDTVLDLVNRLLVELSDETSQSAGMDRPKIIADLSAAPDRWTAFLAVDDRTTIGIEATAPPGARWDRSVAFYERNGFVFTGRKLKLLLS
jgi:hypothetical protein